MNNGKLSSLWFNYQGLFFMYICPISELTLKPEATLNDAKHIHRIITSLTYYYF